MTDNIEKLYELAGFEKEVMCEWTCRSTGICSPDCEHYDSPKLHYPPFTAEKQLELIKWLGIKYSKYSILHIDKYCDYFRVSFDKDKCKDDAVYEFDYVGLGTDFSQALAGLVCELWDDLTDEQREEVRGILQ